MMCSDQQYFLALPSLLEAESQEEASLGRCIKVYKFYFIVTILIPSCYHFFHQGKFPEHALFLSDIHFKLSSAYVHL